MMAEITEDRFSYLFDIANGTLLDPVAELTLEEREEVTQIRALLDVIDNSWKAAPSELDQIRARFLEKLSVKAPNHPWVTESTVQTLGELVRLSGDDVPTLPIEVYENLLNDVTPVQDLIDPASRTGIIGRAIRSAHIPPTAITDFLLWVNRSVTALFALPGNSQPKYVFTRKQGGKRDTK